MVICLFHSNAVIPALKYGGTERIVWWLGKELKELGHQVNLVAKKGSQWPFGQIIFYNPEKRIDELVPPQSDIIHFHSAPDEKSIKKPYIITCHGNGKPGEEFDINTVFVSENHALRHNSHEFVYNGIDSDDYGKPKLEQDRNNYTFLANAAWKVKNVKGAIRLAKSCKSKIDIIGGHRINTRMGIKIYFDKNASFKGMVGGRRKNAILNNSKGLIFPVLWHEPFGLAMIEAMYFGCPVFATPWGSIPEIVTKETGFYSHKAAELIDKMLMVDSFSPQKIHDYVVSMFNSKKMTTNYLKKYERVLNAEKLNQTKPRVLDNQVPETGFKIDYSI